MGWTFDGVMTVVFVVFILLTTSALTAFSNAGKLDATATFLAIGIVAFLFREFAIHLDSFGDGLVEPLTKCLEDWKKNKN